MVAEKVFAVMAESTRRDILEALAQESKAVGQLVDELGVSQPTVSKHLRVLREAGVVTMRAQGQKRFYGINTEPLALVAAWLELLGAGVVPGTAPGTDNGQPVRAATSPAAPDQEEPAPATGNTPAAASSGSTAGRGPAPTAEEPVPDRTLVAAYAQAALAADALTDAPAPEPAAAPTPEPAAAPAPALAPAAAPAPAPAPAVSSQLAALVQLNEHDGGVQSHLSRSVGRAANKAVDLLSNLPTLPTFRRRKD